MMRCTLSRFGAASPFAAGLAMLLAGCAVGPDYHAPQAPETRHYGAEPVADRLGGGKAPEQTLVTGEQIAADWWKAFASEPLNQLVEQGLANSNNIKAARAKLREVEENLNAQVGSVFYPAVDAKASAGRQKISGATFGGRSRIYNLYNASVTASYGIDLFGGSRRYLEALESDVDHARFQLQAARMTLVSNIVTAAVQEASLRSQTAVIREMISDAEAQLGLVERQFELGAVSRTAVLSQRTALAQTRALLPPLQQQLQQTRHLLSVLVGRLPSQADMPEFSLATLHLPATLPLSLPSELVRQRPDILAAEAMLHQANAYVGVATANMYPRITLTGSFGSESPNYGNLFGPGSTVWSAGAGILQPLFHGGELRAKKRGAEAVYDQALATYRETVLQAFREVADALQALAADGETMQLQLEAEKAAADSYELVNQRFAAGAASYLELLTARQQYQQASIDRTRAEAARFADSAALIFALGGGWWNQSDAPQGQQSTEKRP